MTKPSITGLNHTDSMKTVNKCWHDLILYFDNFVNELNREPINDKIRAIRRHQYCEIIEWHEYILGPLRTQWRNIFPKEQFPYHDRIQDLNEQIIVWLKEPPFNEVEKQIEQNTIKNPLDTPTSFRRNLVKHYENPNPTSMFKPHDSEYMSVIPVFSGDAWKFSIFVELFECNVIQTNATNAQKLACLRQKLSGRPAELTKSYNDGCFEDAWNVLMKEYSDATNIRMQMKRTINDLPYLKYRDDVETFEEIVSKLRVVNNIISELHLDIAFENEICSIIYTKFPSYITDAYLRESKFGQYKTKKLLSHLEKELEIPRQRRLISKQIAKLEENKPKNKQTGSQRYQANTEREVNGSKEKQIRHQQAEVRNLIPCNNCQSQRHIATFYMGLTCTKRHESAVEGSLCLKCLQKDHETKRCPRGAYRCQTCNGSHHYYIRKKIHENRKSRNQANVVEHDTGNRNDELNESVENPFCVETVIEIHHAEITTKGTIFVPVEIQGETFPGLVDTGANVNLIPEKVVKILGMKTNPTHQLLNTPNGTFVSTETVTVEITIGDITRIIKFLIHHQQGKMILGTEVIKKFALNINDKLELFQRSTDESPLVKIEPYISNEINTITRPDLFEKLIISFKPIFTDTNGTVGEIKTEECRINLQHELPINIRPYRCSEKDQEIIDKKIEELKTQGMVENSTSPYSFPIVLVNKKDDGEKTRLCINYQKLNDITITESFPLPTIESIQDKLVDASIFSTLDIHSAFYHIKVNEADKPKTGFSSNNGHYHWNRMPFGIKNAPIIFQRVIFNLIFKHNLQSFCINYIDDIIIFSETEEKHLEHLKAIFEMLKIENIKLKLSKCEMVKYTVNYLGHIISKNEIRPLSSNTVAIENLTPPTDLTTLRSFIGKVHYYKKFIENRAVLFYPLYQLLKKGVTWKWDEDCQRTFEEVKRILTSSPVLRIFHPKKPIFLYTDCSGKGMGAVLKQSEFEEDKQQFVVGYFSKPLQKYQTNYSATELELLAIVEAIKNWHFYLVGRHFTIITDHLPLTAVRKFDKPNTRLFNWAMILSQYDFQIGYRPGKENQEADYLSRHPINELKTLVENQVLWIDQKIIEDAQENLVFTKRMKRIFQETINGKKRVFYRKAGVEKDYIPKENAKIILHELHLEKGHIGKKQMELQFCRKYYCPNLNQILKEIVLDCNICQQVKRTCPQYGTLGAIGPAETPLQIIHIDTKSGLKHKYGSPKDNLHLAIDAFTRFVWGVTSKTKIANDFINLINQIMTIQKPELIVSDNYPAIKSKEFRKFLENRNIKILFTSTDHPMSNGIVERVNGTLIEKLSCKRIEQPNIAWTTLMKKCIAEYNDTIHTVTKYTPSYLLTGIDHENLFEDDNNLNESREKAKNNSWDSHLRNARYFDEGRVDPDYQIGDEVMIKAKNKLNRGLLDPAYEGPYVITKIIGHTTYEIERNGKVERHHVSKIKPTQAIGKKRRPSSPIGISKLFTIYSKPSLSSRYH